MHFQSLDHPQTGVDESNTLVGGYESFNQSSSQFEQYGDIFVQIQTVEPSSTSYGTDSKEYVNNVSTGE